MNLRRLWSSSTLLRVASVLGVVTLLAIAVVLTAAVITEQSTGKGAAINIAGSLRMQSYLLATRVAEGADARADSGLQRKAIAVEIAAWESRLADPRLTGAIPAKANSTLRLAYNSIAAQWQHLRRLATESTDSVFARDAFLQGVHPFVADVDRLVVLIEGDLESRIHGLQVALGAALFVILVLVLTAIFVLDLQVFQPIKDLARVAQSVRQGDFSVRTDEVGEDELGQLGRDFNHMVEELGRLYGSLEGQIAAKTTDLAQKNQSLSLLYETARELSVPTLAAETLQRVAMHVRKVLDVEGVVICARHAPAKEGIPLAYAEAAPGMVCEQVRCQGCLDEGHIVWHELAGTGGRRVLSVPLLEGERQYGVMPLQLAPGQVLPAWQIELAQTLGRHIGAALAAAEARDEHRRLALFEERSAIARELHDSLAQSLSYTKIQLARLSALLPAGAQEAEAVSVAGAREVVQELRDGVSSAYRQLRELLTTFRLQLSGKGLTQAIAEAVTDFRQRTEIDVALDDQLIGIELTANQQIHVLQIVREALANIEHHSQARHASVRLARGDGAGGARHIEVAIEDDGVGIPSLESPRQHFGLLIMRDRAQMVGGTLEIGRRPTGGTFVRLRVRMDAPFSAALVTASDARPEPASTALP